MKALMHVFVYILILVSYSENASRMKRKVVFRKNSKFFLRLNGKEPILPFTTVFQHGWGFRMNWEMPDSIPKFHRLFRRDVSTDIEEYFKQPELESYFCLFKQFSTVITNIKFGEYCGVLCEISKIVKRSTGEDLKFYKSIIENLQNFNGNCPSSNYVLSTYTDV